VKKVSKWTSIRERNIAMDKRRDDRDARKSHDEATEDPFEADKETDQQGQQAAELQVGEERERENLSRFEPDPKAKRLHPDPKEAEADHTPPLKKDAVDEP
jgi:hypothetical protein